MLTFGALIGAFTANFALVESGRNLTAAVNHARCVMEEIRDRTPPSTSASQAELSAWAQDVADWAERDLTDPNGGGGCNSLNGEGIQLTATYPSGGGTRPVEFLVSVNWTEKGRPRSTQLVTLLTER